MLFGLGYNQAVLRDKEIPSVHLSLPLLTTKLLQAAKEHYVHVSPHLANKELEVESIQVSIATREDLSAHRRALVDCGWAWGKMGKVFGHYRVLMLQVLMVKAYGNITTYKNVDDPKPQTTLFLQVHSATGGGGKLVTKVHGAVSGWLLYVLVKSGTPSDI
ncbi:uncharacterized protein EDB91DRAFT_1079680 [Suillus paluster]|uniref:uncharacterized protein n=1 Tax=Suillus paluster TaxID=48578 RepID=UPI001B86BA0D|nr:uncharacterized protein EDB91DRAFT_1079680 [Suillus paluster]KAG1747042.1 hypothetical protein EDB91DRAFT_1079680 [Suillus paluster]